MPLPSQTIPVIFGQGLDTKSDPKVMVPGKFTTLENCVFTRPGILQKRYGYDALPATIAGTGSTLATAQSVVAYNDELLQFTGQTVYSYSPSSATWLNRGVAVSAIPISTPVVRNSASQSNPDSAVRGGVRVTAWEDSRGGVRYSVQDVATGGFFVSDAQASATAAKPRVVAFGGEVVIFYALSNNLFYRRITTIAPTALGGEINVVSTLQTGGTANTYDARTIGARIFLAWNDSSTSARLAYLDSSYALASPASIGHASGNAIALASNDTQSAIVILADASGVYSCIYSYGLAALQSVTTIEAITLIQRVAAVQPSGAALVTVLYEQKSPVNDPSTNLVRINTLNAATNAVGTAADFKRGTGLASSCFTIGAAGYVALALQTPLQPAFFVVNLAGNIVAKAHATFGGGLRSNAMVSGWSSPAANQYETAFAVAGRTVSQGGTLQAVVGVNATKFDFASLAAFASVKLNNNMVTVGGVVQGYDGVSLYESGFHVYPEGVTTSTGAGTLPAGTYQYVVLYEWPDNYGQTHRSTTSVPVSVTLGGAGSVTLTIPTLRLTARDGTARAAVRVAVYRTIAAGTIFYRVSAIPSPTINTLGADTVTVTDQAADASITSNEILYTTGAVLDNSPPPPASIIATYRSRVFLAGLEDKNVIAYSQVAQNGDAVRFSDLYRISVDPRGGPITALAGMDDKLVIFKSDAIYVMVGDGPNYAGAANNFSQPQLVTVDAGCINAQSVVSFSGGLMFQSSKGIYLLDRSLQAQYIGAPVEGLAAGLTITAATLVSARNQVRFVTSQGPVLVFDYHVGEWSSFTNLPAVGCTTWQGAFVLARADGGTWKENAGFLDPGGVPIKMRAVTGWLSFAGVLGFQRVRRLALLGDYRGAHTLQVSIATDESPAFSQVVQIPATSIVGSSTYGSDPYYGASAAYGGAYSPYIWGVHIRQQKGTAIRIAIEDIQSSGYNEGLALNAIAFDVGMKPGHVRLPAVRGF